MDAKQNKSTNPGARPALRAAMRRFKAKHVFTQAIVKDGLLRITGIFEDRKEGEPRVILLHAPDADLAGLKRLAARAFKGHRWKLVEQRGPAVGTARSGEDIFRDHAAGQGTLGGWLVHQPTGQCYGFSNNHVIASLGNAPVGSAVYQGGKSVGALHAYIQLDQRMYNTADLAIFAVGDGVATHWTHPAPGRNIGAWQGMAVYKHGSATGETHGIVKNLFGAVCVELTGVPYWFDGVITIEGQGGAFSEAGDSGALVLTRDQHRSTAILFAKDLYSGHSYAFPIGAAHPLFRNLHYAQ